MIPKKIHYCWFGGKPLTDEVRKCINSWREICPDYEIIRWDEKNFDVFENNYCREAYGERKWAFVSDYARLKILYENGGIYMDTDVEVIKSYDSLLSNKVFCCFEDNNNVSIGTFGAEKGNNFVKKLLDKYENRTFIKDNKELDMTTNLKIATELLVNQYSLLLNGNFQILRNEITIYPKEYFIAKNYKTGEYTITDDTYAIHHYNGSWQSKDDRIYRDKYIEYWHKLSWIKCLKFRHVIAASISMLMCKSVLGLIRIITVKLLKFK